MIGLKLESNTVPHLKALRYGKFETRGLSCGGTSSICQAILKSDNLLHKWGFADSQMKSLNSLKGVFYFIVTLIIKKGDCNKRFRKALKY